MPENEIEMTIPVNTVRNTDTEVVVKAGGRKIGSLKLSQDSIAWDPASRSESVSLSWERFSKLMTEARADVAESPSSAARRGRGAAKSGGRGRGTASASRGGRKAAAPKAAAPRATKAVAKAGAARGRGRKSAVDASVVREWANANGIAVSTRGRIRGDVLAAYQKAN